MCERFHQLLAVGRWFPPGTPVSSTRKLISSSSSFHRLDVAEALTPNTPNQTSVYPPPTLASVCLVGDRVPSRWSRGPHINPPCRLSPSVVIKEKLWSRLYIYDLRLRSTAFTSDS